MRIALLGLGFMGSMHLRTLMRRPGITLSAVAGSEPDRLNGDFRNVVGNIGGAGELYDFSAVRKYSDPLLAARDPEIDIVDICLPTDLHRELAVAALRAGKHVLLEKPMALDREGAEAILTEAREAGRILMVAHVVRFFGAYEALREAVETERYGRVRSAFFRRRCAAPAAAKWIHDKSRSGGGVFDLLIHDVDQCIHLFGAPAQCASHGYEDLANGIDQLTATLVYPGGLAATVTGGWHHRSAYPFSQEFTVSFDGGTLEYSSSGRPLTFYAPGKEPESIEVSAGDGYEAEIDYFLRCCAFGEPPALCPPEHSAAATALTAELVRSRNS